MLQSTTPLEASDAGRLAHLHESTLPTSVLGRTSTNLLMTYYDWIARSPAEHLFVVRRQGIIAGAAVLSLEPATLLRRFVRSAPLGFLTAVATRLARDGVFRKEIAAYLREQLTAGPPDDGGPELVQLFVDPVERRRSVASDLLTQIATLLGQRGMHRYSVRTLSHGNDEVLEFYKRRGFTPQRETRFCGTTYVLLTWRSEGTSA